MAGFDATRRGPRGSSHHVALACALLLCAASARAAIPTFYVSGCVWAGPSPGIYNPACSGWITPGDGVADTATWLGRYGDYAESSYDSDLQTASVGVYAFATNGAAGAAWYEAGATAVSEIKDTLYFRVPAGVYPNGVGVVFRGRVEGKNAASRWADGQLPFQASVGPWVHEVTRIVNPASGDTFGDVDESFEIGYTLLAAGTEWRPEVVKAVPVRLLMDGSASTRMNSLLPGIDRESTAMELDFLYSGRFYAIETTPGVTWTSASGVFMIPEPSTYLMLSAGLDLPAMTVKTRRAAKTP
jgi:hypothetical protein